MKKSIYVILTAVVIAISQAGSVLATPDQYLGDSAIYSGTATGVKPNVLFIIDNSAGMGQPGSTKAYDPSKTYPGAYTTDEVYVREAATKGTYNYNDLKISTSGVTCTAAHTALTGTGAYYGPLTNKGSCGNSNTQSGNYYTGNLLNYMNSPTPSWNANTAYNVDDVVIPTSGGGLSYVCVQAGTSGGSEPSWPSTTATTVTDGSTQWVLRPSSILNMIQTTIGQVAAAVRDSVNIGLMEFGNNNHGGLVLQPVRDISDTSANGPAGYASLVGSLQNMTLLSSNQQPINEALWDGGVYYRGDNSDTQQKISSDNVAYPSPIDYYCQKNYIVVLTTGNSPDTTHTKQHLTDLNSDGTAGDAEDSAIYNYITDNSSTLSDSQSVQTTVIQLLSVEVPILEQAAESGHGEYYNVWNTTQLTQALYDTMTNIVKSVDTSFVAPVVPVSPENRTYSGSRVYMGFFKPITQSYWHGNLKKYGVGNVTFNGMSFSNVLTDKSGNQASYVDNDGNGYDDIKGDQLPSGAGNGSFRSGATSFWSSTADGGSVESGGVGSVLLNRDYSSDPRKIYTFTGSNTALTNSSNAFSSTNAAITPSLLGLSTTTDVNNLINFIYGLDSYDENNNGNTTEKRAWIMGDVLHSKPLIVNYSSYQFTSANESDCSVNKTMTYVGSNDGMLHAFNDCDGSEAWAFIPPDVLPNLQNISGQTHNYYVDSSPVAYISGNKVILIFGERRGGGSSAAPTGGSYYALDVSNPAAPTFLWRISNSSVTRGTTTTATSDFSELAETWSEPKIVHMKIGGSNKIVAFVGAGYDNGNEDSRYGGTQTFNGTGAVVPTDLGNGAVTSSGASAPSSPKGRGIYAIEIATITSGVPDFTNSGTKVWGYTHANNSNMAFSFPTEISALDINNDGYADRLYTADTGGNVWRLNVGSTDTSNWSAAKIFSLNPGSGGSSDTGRKIFYKPSITIESDGTVMLFFGTGDREHPLNWAVTDRFYALKDKGQTTVKTESDLLDVTTDQLQTTTVTSGTGSISDILSTLNSSSNYGWYIKLDQNLGEKVLAAPTVFNKVAYFSTYAPDTSGVADPCEPGNLGTARLYAVNYQTGEAVLNYDTGNDSNYSNISNTRATSTPGQVLLRSDRVMTIGSGIPSGMVMIINPNGEVKALIGVGGVIPSENPKRGGSIIPLYWRQK